MTYLNNGGRLAMVKEKTPELCFGAYALLEVANLVENSEITSSDV